MRNLYLAVTTPVILTAVHSIAPAQACKAPTHSASLCTVVAASTDVRGKPNGRVEYTASGNVLVAGQTKDGLWARIEVPCAGYKGWIARQDLACEGISASARRAANR
jgi:hypothetical protein